MLALHEVPHPYSVKGGKVDRIYCTSMAIRHVVESQGVSVLSGGGCIEEDERH